MKPLATPPTAVSDGPILIPADLIASDAASVHGGLLARMREGAGCVIEIGEGPPSPLAIQLVVAAQRMAERDALATRLGPRALAALARLGTSEQIGE